MSLAGRFSFDFFHSITILIIMFMQLSSIIMSILNIPWQNKEMHIVNWKV